MNTIIKKTLHHLGFHSKPSFLIIGAQKAGTYGLFYTLKQHPLLSKSIHKEIHYFNNDKWYTKSNIKEYLSYFPTSFEVHKDSLLFEATPDYLFHPQAAKRIYDFNPKMKLIILLRNPTERAISAWTMFHHQADKETEKHIYDPRNFTEAIEEEISQFPTSTFYTDFRAYIKRGIYELQIQNYLRYFPKEQILFVENEELKKDHQKALNIIFEFLEIPEIKVKQLILNQRVIDVNIEYQKTLLFLDKFYKPYNESLFKLLKKRYDW